MINEVIKEVKNALGWYFLLKNENRIRTNYIVMIALLLMLSYRNDKQHRENYIDLCHRNDAINNSRTKEQEKYTVKLEFYTDKFNRLLEILLKQKEEQKKINKDK